MPALALAPKIGLVLQGLRSFLASIPVVNRVLPIISRIGASVWVAIGTGVGWLASLFSGVIQDFAATTVFETAQESVYAIAYFDWNQSDASIKQQIEANNLAMIQLAGRFAGSGAVRITSVGVAAGAALRYPVIAGRIAKTLAEDTSETLRGEFVGMVQGLRQLAVENALLATILMFRQRRWFGQEPRPDDGPVSTIAGRIDERVQAIDNAALRSFVMGALEGAEDAFWDVGYIVSTTIDDIVAANRFARESELGPTRAVKVFPDARNDDEAIVISGPETVVQTSIESTLATHQLVYNRDVGQIVGIPAEHFQRARISTRALVVVFKSRSNPPWTEPNGRRSKEVHYSIPDAKRGLSWAELKAAARPFTWGPWRATALLDNNRQMAIYGVSENEAVSQLRSLLLLSTAELVSLTVSEEKVRNPANVKRPTQMWPAYANLVVAPTDFQGVPVGGDRAFRRERRRITLWTDQDPDNLGPLG